MNIYLDVNGVLLTHDLETPLYADTFLRKIFSLGEVYWLTTHCKNGDATGVIEYLSRVYDEDTIDLLKKVKPTTWQTLKTEAIDFNQDFLWFDDAVLEIEKKILKEKECLDSWVKVDLRKNPNQLGDFGK